MRNPTVCFLVLCIGVMTGLLCGCEKHSDNPNIPSQVSLSPESVQLKAGEVATVQFTATGGDGQYTWAVSDNMLGSLSGIASNTVSSGTNSPSGGTNAPAANTTPGKATYTSTTRAGVNTVTVFDFGGSIARTIVTQE